MAIYMYIAPGWGHISPGVNFFSEDFIRVFTIYGHGGHLGHVTWIIYIYIGYPFLFMLHMKFGFDWPSSFRGEEV